MYNSIFFYCLILAISLSLRGQSQNVLIRNISVTGNTKTKANVLLREMDLKVNDTVSLAVLPSRIDENEQRLLSTVLLSWLDINIRLWEDSFSFMVVVS